MKSHPNFMSDYDAGFWARLMIGLRTVWVAGCGMARKRSARWTLWHCTRTMVSSGFTRSTCLLNCLMPSWPKFIKFKLYLIKSYFQFWNFDSPTYLPVSIIHYLHRLPDWSESSKQYGLELPPLPLLLTTQITFKHLVWSLHGEWDNWKLFVVFHFTPDVI